MKGETNGINEALRDACPRSMTRNNGNERMAEM
jgi:hypothetical protein